MNDIKKNTKNSVPSVSSRVTHYEKMKIEKANINSHDFLKLGIKTYYENREKAELELNIESIQAEINELLEKKEYIEFKINKKVELKEELLFKLGNLANIQNNLERDSKEIKACERIISAFNRKKERYTDKDINAFLNDKEHEEFIAVTADNIGLSSEYLKKLVIKQYD